MHGSCGAGSLFVVLAPQLAAPAVVRCVVPHHVVVVTVGHWGGQQQQQQQQQQQAGDSKTTCSRGTQKQDQTGVLIAEINVRCRAPSEVTHCHLACLQAEMFV